MDLSICMNAIYAEGAFNGHMVGGFYVWTLLFADFAHSVKDDNECGSFDPFVPSNCVCSIFFAELSIDPL